LNGLMMASIFFTARLPASRSNSNVLVRMRFSHAQFCLRCAGMPGQPSGGRSHPDKMPVSTTNRSGFLESRVYAKLQMP
jgi:hypothetical protein